MVVSGVYGPVPESWRVGWVWWARGAWRAERRVEVRLRRLREGILGCVGG